MKSANAVFTPLSGQCCIQEETRLYGVVKSCLEWRLPRDTFSSRQWPSHLPPMPNLSLLRSSVKTRFYNWKLQPRAIPATLLPRPCSAATTPSSFSESHHSGSSTRSEERRVGKECRS